MGKEMDDVCAEHGIRRQHSVRARHQQNGVLKMTVSTSHVVVGIFLIIYSSIDPINITLPFSLIMCCNMGLLSVPTGPWSKVLSLCLGGLGSHMEKCISTGYPPDYKGWKFYNPATKKSVISDCAQFDECYFLGIKESVPSVIPTTLLEYPPTHTTPSQQPSSIPLDISPPGDSDEGSEHSGDVYDHGGGSDGSAPPHPYVPW